MRKRGFWLAPLSGVVTGVYVLGVTGTAFAQVHVAPPPPIPIGGTVHVNVQGNVGTPAATAAPAAAASGDDTVYLRDGGMIRGTIMEVIPGNHVSVQLANGQVATIRWDVIDRIDRHSQPGQTTVAPPPTTTAPPQPTGSVLVHMEGSDDVVLEQLSSSGAWREVCAAPCDKPLALGMEYRIGGSGTRASKPFDLEAENGQRLVLDVSRASSGAYAGGIVLISLGSVATFVGLIVLAVGGLQNDISNNGGGTVATGLVITGVGLASLIVGIVLTVGNKHTAVNQAMASADTGGPRVASLFGTPEKRLPAWFDGVNHRVASTPAAPVVPLFSTAF